MAVRTKQGGGSGRWVMDSLPPFNLMAKRKKSVHGCRKCGQVDGEIIEENGMCMLCSIQAHRGEPACQIPILLRYLQILMRRCRWRKLTHRQSEAFRLVHLQGCSAAEAGRLMGCTRANVNQLLRKIKKNYPALFVEKGGLRILQLPPDFESLTEEVF